MTNQLVGTELAGTTIARRMREVRTRRGWSQDDLAARIREIGGRISRPVLYKIEEGKTRSHRLSVEEFLIIAAALGVAPIHLMTDPSEDEDGAPIGAQLSITPSISMVAPHVRAWFSGNGGPPGGGDLRFYLSERPESQLRQIHAQWIDAADDWHERYGTDAVAPDPRVVDEDAVTLVPAMPKDDRRKNSRRGN